MDGALNYWFVWKAIARTSQAVYQLIWELLEILGVFKSDNKTAFGVVLDFGTKASIDCSIGMECIAAANRYREEGE